MADLPYSILVVRHTRIGLETENFGVPDIRTIDKRAQKQKSKGGQDAESSFVRNLVREEDCC